MHNQYDREWYELCQVSDLDIYMEEDGVAEMDRDIRDGRAGIYPLKTSTQEYVTAEMICS